jgi:hypothetical protein
MAPRNPKLPASKFTNPIDRFLDRAITEPVPDHVFARRAYLDVTGIPPSPAQLEKFTKDTNSAKRTQLVDSLLAESKLYSGNWMSFWNDLLRNDPGVNYAGTRESITPWLEKALASNMPYDQMVAALVNPVKPDDPKGFLLGVNWRGTVSASQTPYMQAAQNTAQLFLGVNLKCASCHDSFINRYKLKQSYGMAALFSESNDLELVRCDVKQGVRTQAEFLFPELGAVPANASLEQRHAAAAQLFTSPKNGRLARTMANRMWQKLLGRGLVEPVDEMDARPWNEDLLDWLAFDFASNGYDLKHLMRQIMTSRAYQMAADPTPEEKNKAYVFHGPRPRRLTAEQFIDTMSSVTGEWPVKQSERDATLVRDWALKSTDLSRAMGRPIRDQVFTTRNSEATMLQALELVNGATMESMLRRGARRMLGELPAAPAPLFDSKTIRKNGVDVDIDVTGAKQLWFLLTDVNSYDPTRTIAGWESMEFSGPRGTKKLSELPTVSAVQKSGEQLIAAVPSTLVYNIEGLGFTRLKGRVFVDPKSETSEINPAIRFYVFSAEPDRHQLVKVTGEAPVPSPAITREPDALVNQLFLETLCRTPNEQERLIARNLVAPNGKVTTEGLEDVLWTLFMHPEMQLIY